MKALIDSEKLLGYSGLDRLKRKLEVPSLYDLTRRGKKLKQLVQLPT